MASYLALAPALNTQQIYPVTRPTPSSSYVAASTT